MIDLSWHSLKLKNPYLFKGQIRTEKTSAILSFKTSKGDLKSELSVFPGLHDENKESYNLIIKDINWNNLKAPSSPLLNLEELCAFAKKYRSSNLSGNLLFALDGLLLQFLGIHKKLPPKLQEIFKMKALKVKTALLVTDLESSLPQSDRKLTYKVKVGRLSIQKEIKLLKKLFELNPYSQFRLDANKHWNSREIKTLEKNLHRSEREKIQYLEEPCESNLLNGTDLPVAWETFNYPQLKNLKFIVIKPAVEKGIFEGLLKIQSLKMQNLTPILSSTFESSLGLRNIALMSLYTSRDYAHGLGTIAHIIPQNLTETLATISLDNGLIEFSGFHYE
mgnify:CR=1 FL=1